MSASDSGQDIPPPPGMTPFLLVLLIALGLIGWGAYGQWQRDGEATRTLEAIRTLVPHVRTVVAERADGPVDLTLPGETRPFLTAAIAARATGYIAERKIDIGSRVKAGDLLLRIAAPDLDQQLVQARAQLGQFQAQKQQADAQVEQAKANVNLANLTNNRTTTLADQGWASRQNADTSQAGVLSQAATLAAAEAGVKVAIANIRSQESAVERLRALTDFERVVAPFDGVVTMRSVDVGDLVRADNGGTALLSVDQVSTLRIAVNVPQNLTRGVTPGVVAQVRVPQLPGRTFLGSVERSSTALQASSRTLTTEVDVPNQDGLLRAGLHADVTLRIPRDKPGVIVPAEAIVFANGTMQVAVLKDDNRITWRKVQVKRDFGRVLELDGGVDPETPILFGPSPNLPEDQLVQPGDRGGGRPMRSAER
jgi:RND family efflux transporter MFP subunit